MKYVFIFLLCFFLAVLLISACSRGAESTPTYASFEEYPVYEGDDLGLTYSPRRSTFKVWSPPADALRLRLYETGEGGEPRRTIDMKRGKDGVWTAVVKEDLIGKYYTFQASIEAEWQAEVVDPYAKAVGVNGRRGQVIDLAATEPEGWDADSRPPFEHPTDAVIYELHIRDLSVAENSGIIHKGKYLGLAETGTTGPQGLSTGLDHIREMGVTHLHLLPVFDYRSIDETKLEENKFNWGYDPQNYNVPEGSYATDPYDGAVRIREFKTMVKTLHDNGIRVVMDVVYNHTGYTGESLFNQLVPGYYYRQNEEGAFSDASACGNETASERPMVRKFIIESVLYWAREYHIDGFRFDLMGIHDIETMNQVSAALHAVDPTILIYGEGWTAGNSPLPDTLRALKKYAYRLDSVAVFSDNMRDGIKGHVFTHDDPGFASGKPGMDETVKFGIVASTEHPQVNYDSVHWLDPKRPWAGEPYHTVNYCSCHDNHTLWDRLTLSRPDVREDERIKMHKLAGAIVLTSQGIAFLHAGTEMLRTKDGVENSFESPDSINQIDWSRKAEYSEVVSYYQGLIRLRKNHPAFRLTSTEAVQQHLRFLDTPADNLIAYTLSDHAGGDEWSDILVALNGSGQYQSLDLPEGDWRIVVDGEQVDENGLGEISDAATIPAYTAMVLAR